MNRFTKISNTGKDLKDTAKKWNAVRDNTTGLIWSARNVGKEQLSHAKADAAAKAVDLCGASDWRLPTVEELFCLADRTRSTPAIDTAFFKCHSSWYWSSSAVAGGPDYAWGVDFYYGYSDYGNRYDTAFVRAVRGPVAVPGQ